MDGQRRTLSRISTLDEWYETFSNLVSFTHLSLDRGPGNRRRNGFPPTELCNDQGHDHRNLPSQSRRSDPYRRAHAQFHPCVVGRFDGVREDVIREPFLLLCFNDRH